jgi:glycosidase
VKLPFTRLRPRRPRPGAHSFRRPALRAEALEARLVPDTSAPVTLQYFEGSYNTIEQRAADIFKAGYGAVYLPPPGRADSGNQSVGYDVYNRFDLGSPGNPTLYGTETGLKSLVNALHQTGASVYSDLVWNHDGFSNLGTSGFAAAGGYPGFALTLSPSNNYAGYNDIDGDFHSAFDTSTFGMRLDGLIDIAQEKNYQFIRNPVDPSNPMNLPAGTTPAFGRLANVPDPNNARFYPDTSLPPISVFDPTTGESNIKIYPFNNADPLHGTPVPENALGYLMRYAQWMVQYVGVDGFRVDAAKSMPPWVLNYLDRAVYRSSFRTRLDGSQEPIFSFSEVFDGDKSLLQQYVRKDINPADPGTIGGNRDVLDFPLYFALDNNLTGNGLQNDWTKVVNASQDGQDDGLANNGSEGVSFVSNQDVTHPYLDNVAYAYTLTHPGNAIVYFNAHEFGTGRSFPNDGRGDALGGLYGNTITDLVNIRNTHPDGNYDQRDLEKEILIYERDDSMLVALNNRLDSGFDNRTVHTDFAPGTYLIELTGNATDPGTDPDGAIPPLLQVDGSGDVNLRVPRNVNDAGTETDKGYVIYAPSGPQGALHLNGVDHVIPGETPTAGTNGTARLSSIPVITGGTFQIELDTNAVNLLGNPAFRDHDADGDNALFQIDGGTDATGGGFVDTHPGDVAYGFQQFTTGHSPGFFSADGNGQYVQTIDTSKLSNGMHYITVRAFRHRNSDEPPIFTDFRVAIYVDHAPTLTSIVSFNPIVAGVNENRELVVQALDPRINNVHVFFDLPAGLTDAQVVSMVGSGSQANQLDRNLWTKDVSGLTSGNHVATVVSFQIDGHATVQRFPGLFTPTVFGAGLGDLNFDGQYSPADVSLFQAVLQSDEGQFNPAADLNGDGLIDNRDLLLLAPRLKAVHADAATLAAYNSLLGPTAGGFIITAGNPVTLGVNQPTGTGPALTFSWDLNHDGVFGDVTGPAPTVSWAQLNGLGILAPGVYPIAVRVSDGTESDNFSTTLTVNQSPAFTSARSTVFDVGSAGTFTVTTTGFPTPALGESGSLPGGVSFVDNSNGTATLSGTPTAGGTFTFVITADNGVLPDATQRFTLTVNPPVIVLNPAALSPIQVGVRFSQAITAGGGTVPYHFRISRGRLPLGVTLEPLTGILGGTPRSPGTAHFNVTVTDSSIGAGPYTSTRSFALTVKQGDPARLVFLTPPNTSVRNGLLAPFRVLVLDLFGNRLNGVVVSLAAVPLVGGAPPQFSAGSVVRVKTVNGVATFSHVGIVAHGRYALLVNAGGVDLSSDAFGVGRPVPKPAPVPGVTGDRSGRQL